MNGRTYNVIILENKVIVTNQQIDSCKEEARCARGNAGVAQTIQRFVHVDACKLIHKNVDDNPVLHRKKCQYNLHLGHNYTTLNY